MDSTRQFSKGTFQFAVLLFATIGSLVSPPETARAESGNGNGNSPHVFRVVDKRGKLVGYSLTENLVAREVNGVWVTFYVQPGRGIFDSKAIYFFYLTTDCSGPRYIPHYSTFAEGTRVGPSLQYPVGASELNPRSVKLVSGNGEEGFCTAATDEAGVYGVATSVEIDSFNVEPPFKATQ
jgi:hypothetical protein